MTIKTGVFYAALGLWLLSFTMSAWADLDTKMNRSIVEALEHDTNKAGVEKLFKNRCDTIARYIGFEESLDGKARQFSCDVPGVGITLYAGSDLGKHSPEKVGQYFVDYLKNEGVDAQVFIKPDHEYGSSIAFYINGASWLDFAIRPSEGLEKLSLLAAESKLILLTDGRVDHYLTGIKAD